MKAHHALILLVTIAALAFLTSAWSADIRVRVDTPIAVCWPHDDGCVANLTITADVPRDHRNRWIAIVLTSATDDAGYTTASGRQIDGEAGPRSYRVEYRAVPADTYLIIATLYRSDGAEMAQTRARIVGDR